MAIEIKAPTYPESVQEGTLATWYKQAGDHVSRDDLIVDIETDKVVLEVVAPASGTITEVLKVEGDIVLSNEVLARIEEASSVKSAQPLAASAKIESDAEVGEVLVNPAAKKLAEERDIDLALVKGTGKGGRITKEDIVNHAPPPLKTAGSEENVQEAVEVMIQSGERVERRVAMTRMRSRISERLMSVTQSTAMLTTFNEVDMSTMMGSVSYTHLTLPTILLV